MRVWEILPKKQSMREALKEHKGAVTCIKIRKNDLEVRSLYTLCSVASMTVSLCCSVLQLVLMEHASYGT